MSKSSFHQILNYFVVVVDCFNNYSFIRQFLPNDRRTFVLSEKKQLLSDLDPRFCNTLFP